MTDSRHLTIHTSVLWKVTQKNEKKMNKSNKKKHYNQLLALLSAAISDTLNSHIYTLKHLKYNVFCFAFPLHICIYFYHMNVRPCEVLTGLPLLCRDMCARAATPASASRRENRTTPIPPSVCVHMEEREQDNTNPSFG